ncbi:MAG: ATPase [Bacilli bacterium]
MDPIKIAVLSGKGGTGKTFVSVNLASVLKDSCYMDCDVEEPNGNLFFQVTPEEKKDVTVKIPVIDRSKCDGCRICSDFCAFHALIYIVDRIVVLENMCHSCGGCKILCPKQAIDFKEKPIGVIEQGKTKNNTIVSGVMNPNYPSGIPILHEMFASFSKEDVIIMDCCPGASCSVIECVKQADFCLMVAEDSLFGFHNLKMVYELIHQFHKPHAVLINKGTSSSLIEPFCYENKIPMLPAIPFDRTIATLLSQGKILVEHDEKYHALFTQYLQQIQEIYHETITRS